MSTRVFVGGLTYKTRERDIEKFFRKYGRIKEVSMKNGYSFVEFEDYRDAEDAVYEMNGKELNGDRVTVERARGTPRGRDRWRDAPRNRGSPRRGGRDRDRGDRDRDRRDRDRSPRGGRDKYGPPTRTNYRVIVQNLSSKCSWQDLKDLMRKAGEVTFADAHKDDNNEGVVEFATLEDMKNAIEKYDDTEVCGKRIKVVEALKDGGRSRSRSRSAERKRSVSRSPSRSRHDRSRSRSHAEEERGRSRSHSNDRD